jgi:hypothetical protein
MAAEVGAKRDAPDFDDAQQPESPSKKQATDHWRGLAIAPPRCVHHLAFLEIQTFPRLVRSTPASHAAYFKERKNRMMIRRWGWLIVCVELAQAISVRVMLERSFATCCMRRGREWHGCSKQYVVQRCSGGPPYPCLLYYVCPSAQHERMDGRVAAGGVVMFVAIYRPRRQGTEISRTHGRLTFPSALAR